MLCAVSLRNMEDTVCCFTVLCSKCSQYRFFICLGICIQNRRKNRWFLCLNKRKAIALLSEAWLSDNFIWILVYSFITLNDLLWFIFPNMSYFINPVEENSSGTEELSWSSASEVRDAVKIYLYIISSPSCMGWRHEFQYSHT